jgi:hypothetical protein
MMKRETASVDFGNFSYCFISFCDVDVKKNVSSCATVL